MSMLSKNLEKSLHRAFALAGERRHEYATLEHLLLAMTEDEDATPVLKACGVDVDRLRHDLESLHRQPLSRVSSPRRRASRCRPPASSGWSSAPPCTSSPPAARK